MARVDVLNKDGEQVSAVDLNEDIFNVAVKTSVLHEVVTMQLAARRSGSASTKCRSDIIGSGAKLFRQKGTGRARRGDIKSPLLKGGGVVFGPHPKSYAYSVPKKKKRLALKMALSDKLQREGLLVLNELVLEEIKTKKFIGVLEGLGDKINRKSVLFIIDQKNENLELSSRNVSGVKVLRVEGLNVYDILRHENLVLTEASAASVERRLHATP